MRAFINQAKYIFTGYTKGKAQDIDFQCRTIVLIASIAAPTAGFFALVNFLYGREWLGTMLFVATVLLLPCLRLMRRQEHLTFTRNLMMANAMFIFMVVFVDGGITGLSFMWTLILPFVAFLLVGLPAAWYWVLAHLFIQLAFIASHYVGLLTLPYDEGFLTYFPIVFVFFAFVAATFEMHFERLHIRYEESIAELQNLQSNLELNIQRRTTALQNSNVKLKHEVQQHGETSKALHDSEERFFQSQKMESVGTLVGGIAHDFNNMLAGINANLFMMKRVANVAPAVVERAENVEQLVMGASDMIRQLLTFARKDNVEFQNLDLSPFLNEAFKLAEIAVSERIRIRLENNEGYLPVQASGTQLQQVLMNLINNARDAVKHKENPSVIVKLERYKPSERFKGQNPELEAEEYAVLSIIDNGKGIPTHEVDKIFEPFFTTKEVGKGTGLGLAMCYGAVQSHGGTIKVQSKLGTGTAFKVFLPISDGQVSKSEVITQGSEIMGTGETILLVDDDQKLREAQKEALYMLGYTVLEASNGKEAVSLFKENQSIIDLTLMDLTMPVMGGVRAAKLIREISPEERIIFVTGYDKDATLNGETLPDIREFVLEKPYTMDKLNSVIQKQLLTEI